MTAAAAGSVPRNRFGLARCQLRRPPFHRLPSSARERTLRPTLRVRCRGSSSRRPLRSLAWSGRPAGRTGCARPGYRPGAGRFRGSRRSRRGMRRRPGLGRCARGGGRAAPGSAPDQSHPPPDARTGMPCRHRRCRRWVRRSVPRRSRCAADPPAVPTGRRGTRSNAHPRPAPTRSAQRWPNLRVQTGRRLR